jgi:hypothetical protein
MWRPMGKAKRARPHHGPLSLSVYKGCDGSLASPTHTSSSTFASSSPPPLELSEPPPAVEPEPSGELSRRGPVELLRPLPWRSTEAFCYFRSEHHHSFLFFFFSLHRPQPPTLRAPTDRRLRRPPSPSGWFRGCCTLFPLCHIVLGLVEYLSLLFFCFFSYS